MSEVYAAQQVAWPYLLHVVQVLHAWRLPQVDAMSYVLTQHEGTDQMICVTSLPYSTGFSLGTDLSQWWGMACQVCHKHGLKFLRNVAE